MAAPPDTVRRSPLHRQHTAAGARLLPFAGWEMPVQYRGILEEYAAVRNHAGLFDISHMGELQVAGPGAGAALNRLLTNDVDRLAAGRGQYTLLTNADGGIIDDLILYRLEAAVYLLVLNAARTAPDLAWIRHHLLESAALDDQSDRTGAVALQGPAAARILPAAAALPRFGIAPITVAAVPCLVARTGYTGEDGFELLCAAAEVERLWTGLLAAGRPHGLQPCGLGARDLLRLEMGYPLHGQDLTEQTSPVEAGLDRFVAWDKPSFYGRDALLRQRRDGIARRLVAFRLDGKGPPPRPHYPILRDGQRIGEVTSGGLSPALGAGIGLGYVTAAAASPGQALAVEIRGRPYPARVQSLPFYRRPAPCAPQGSVPG